MTLMLNLVLHFLNLVMDYQTLFKRLDNIRNIQQKASTNKKFSKMGKQASHVAAVWNKYVRIFTNKKRCVQFQRGKRESFFLFFLHMHMDDTHSK